MGRTSSVDAKHKSEPWSKLCSGKKKKVSSSVIFLIFLLKNGPRAKLIFSGVTKTMKHKNPSGNRRWTRLSEVQLVSVLGTRDTAGISRLFSLCLMCMKSFATPCESLFRVAIKGDLRVRGHSQESTSSCFKVLGHLAENSQSSSSDRSGQSTRPSQNLLLPTHLLPSKQDSSPAGQEGSGLQKVLLVL